MRIDDCVFKMIGKTIKEVIVDEEHKDPDYHFLIIFNDGSGCEFCADGKINSVTDVCRGSNYTAIFGESKSLRRYYIDEQESLKSECLNQKEPPRIHVEFPSLKEFVHAMPKGAKILSIKLPSDAKSKSSPKEK